VVNDLFFNPLPQVVVADSCCRPIKDALKDKKKTYIVKKDFLFS